jgi:RNA polymerase sigma-70 factor (ECF subfamily)
VPNAVHLVMTASMSDPNRDTIRGLLEARTGSREALGQVLEAYRGYLLVIADKELDGDLKAKGGASDLVQETFLQAHGDFEQFLGHSSPEIKAWLRALLLHRVANFTRRFRHTEKRAVQYEVGLMPTDSQSHHGIALADRIATPSRQVMAREQMQAIQRALDDLPGDYRQVVTLRYQEQKSFDEIGVAMQRSSEAVRKLWWRAIERMQQSLGARHE